MKWGILFICFSFLHAEWTMFHDGKDTYIYSAKTGEVYIKTSMGGKKYEDAFVKMPRGLHPNELKNDTQKQLPLQGSQSEQRELQKQAEELKRSILNKALE